MSMAESCRVREPDPGQVNRPATGEVDRQRQEDARHVAVSPIMDQHNHWIGMTKCVGADHEHPYSPTAEHVVDDVTPGYPRYHAALKSVNADASSPVREACQALAAATARRSRYSRMASATRAERLPPAAATLRSSPSRSSNVIEMLTVTPRTLPTIVPVTLSAVVSACRRVARTGTCQQKPHRWAYRVYTPRSPSSEPIGSALGCAYVAEVGGGG
jgi:hypothetical protein